MLAGVPEITGATLAAVLAETAMLKAGSAAEWVPSETLMTIFWELPIMAVVGVPASRPVAVLKLAHVGLLVIE